MCFTPAISLTTAIVEFVLAGSIWLFFKRATVRDFSVVLIFLLGLYQFSEFMLCTYGVPEFWAALAMVSSGFLPAVGLHGILKFVKRKTNLFLIYLIPILIVPIAFSQNFITTAQCNRFFIEVGTLFQQSFSSFTTFLFHLYLVYYFGFIILICVIAYTDYKKQRSKLKKEVELFEVGGMLLMFIATAILIFLFPVLGISFPSVLCQFAIFVAISLYIAVYLESKIKN